MKKYVKVPEGSESDANFLGNQGLPEPPSRSTPELGEDQALAILQRADVSAEELVSLSRYPDALKSRKVLLALVSHPRTPRHVSLPLLRRMFTFDLARAALAPAVAADIKRAAEEQILVRVDSLPAGEKISLARRGPGRIAAQLLREKDPRIVSVALDNGRLVESAVVTTLMKSDTPTLLYKLVSEHSKWALRREVQIALLTSEKTPMHRAIQLATHFSPKMLDGIAPQSRKAELLHAVRRKASSK